MIGTWIPLHDGRGLADRNGVLEKLLPIFDFVPGERSPPPAPKHATAATNKPRAPKQPAANSKRAPATHNAHARPVRHVPDPTAAQIPEDHYDIASVGQYQHDDTPDNMTVASESMMDDERYGQYAGSRKRKRGNDQMSLHDQQHQIWADQLLDYFMLLESEDSFPSAPEPPLGVNLDRPIDDKGHSALHWAAAMGDIEVVKDLIRRNARIDCLSNNLETPLMRAVMFTNNYDKQSMPQLVRLMAPTVLRSDWFGSTVFHHIAATTSSRNKYPSARYYIDAVVNVLAETWIPDEITRLLNQADQNGDTPIMIAARNGARKCVRSLLGRNVQVDRPNIHGQTADELIQGLNERRRAHMNKNGIRGRELSSSPFAPDGRGMNGDVASIDHMPLQRSEINPPSQSSFNSETANAIAARLLPTIQERLTSLAKAFEQEYATKTEEETEIARVLRKRNGELAFLTKQLEDLAPVEEQLNTITPSDESREAEELGLLEAEAEAWLELEQSQELQSLVTKNVAMAAPPLNGSTDPRLLMQKLADAQQERRGLAHTIVQAIGNAGMGERQDGYKRLIKGAIGVKESEIEGMLDEVLRELEDEARERAAPYGEAMVA